MSRLKPLTDADYEVLNELTPGDSDVAPRWNTPLEIGGSNGSHHSGTLAKLQKRGLVDWKQRAAREDQINRPVSRRRGSKSYRITAAGLAERDAHFGPRRTQAENEEFFAQRRAAQLAAKEPS